LVRIAERVWTAWREAAAQWDELAPILYKPGVLRRGGYTDDIN
jgi:hypothetical protein